MQIQKDISLAQYTTFKIGGRARYFARVKNIEDLKKGVNFARQNSLSFFVLGGGSNLLVSDGGFGGLVIKIEIKGIKTHLETESPSGRNIVIIGAGAGENWDNLVKKTTEQGWTGIENLSGIPGTVGASVVQNIGAFGAEAKDIVFEVEVFDIETGETCLPAGRLKKLNNQQCKFGYRTSLFKTKQGQNLIVTKVIYKLRTDGKLNLEYDGLKEKLKNPKHLVGQASNHPMGDGQAKSKISSADVRRAVLQIRKEKYPSLEKIGTAGCFFKNPIITQKKFEKLKKQFPDLPVYDTPNGKIKISLAWLVDKIGWKEYKNGNVGIHKNHSLMIVNYGNGTSKEVKELANKIARDILLKTNLKISPEVVFV